jgi:SRSO17 transposase
VPAGWVTADAVYGADRGLRGWLEARQPPYVLAVKRTEPLTLPSGPPVPAARLVERIPPACWLRVSAGQGAKGAAGTPGAVCRWTAPARPPGGSSGCWSAAAFAPGS